MLDFDHVTIDLTRHVVHQRDGREVRLTPVEHRVLELMARELPIASSRTRSS